MLKSTLAYLGSYFMKEEIQEQKEKKEEIILRHIVEEQVEEDPDKILEQLWEAGL